MAGQSGSNTPVTLKTIADRLGVSVTTVARALKDGHRISPTMTEKVRNMADELGYVRNMEGVKLRTGKTFIIMAFLRFSNEEEIGDSGSIGLLNGIHQRLADTEYAIRAAPVVEEDDGFDKIMETVKSRSADGIILDHTEPQDYRVRYLLEHNFPFVTFGRTELYSEHAFFDLDNEQTSYQNTVSLIRSGKKRIALIDADKRYLFVHQRLRGYKRALNEANLDYNEEYVKNIPIAADTARTIAKELVKIGVDGFVCVNELVFLGARAGVRSELGDGLKEVGFALRTGTNIAEYIGSSVETSYYSRSRAGWNLADILLKVIRGDKVIDCQRIEQTR